MVGSPHNQRSSGENVPASTKERTAIQRLKFLANEAVKIKHPEIPEKWLPPQRYSDKTANGLTKCIIHWIRLNGGQAERINNTGRPIDNRRVVTDVLGHRRVIGSIQWIPGTGTRGTADISATIKGRSVKIEVKIGRDRQSEYQLRYQAEVEASGGLYFIATSFDQFYQWYNTHFIK